MAGDEGLCREAEETVAAIVGRERDRATVAADVAEMRELMDEERPGRDAFDVKLAEGGLVDLEFMAQFALLTGLVPVELHTRPIADTLAALEDGDDLCAAYRTMSDVLQLTKLCLEGPFDPEEAPRGLVERLLAETGQPDLSRLEAWLEEMQAAVRRRFRTMVG